MDQWLVILNPLAGRRPTPVQQVKESLAQADLDAELVESASIEETVKLIRSEATGGRRRFAVAGGDGTANIAVNALMKLDWDDPPILGVLPVGTGCDLLRTFGLPQDLLGAAQHLRSDDVYPIDVALLEGAWGVRYFVNVAQVGVGAAAAETAPRITRRVGAVRYPLAFLSRLPRFPRGSIKLTTERRTYESEALAVILANAQFFAGGWNVAPRATLVDGVLDVQVIDASKARAPALVPKIIRGTHLNDRAVRRFSAGEFSIETDPVWPLEADGDWIGNTPVSGRVVPAAIGLKI